ncbi:MAG: LacI family DNA-binding transcriptional regulator [Bosea sp. (in: a-proteobacteria)]
MRAPYRPEMGSAPQAGMVAGRVTLQDIAQRLEVSTATVSLALRGSSLVADATRLKVQAAARELGYSYNRSAASLRTARTNMIGVGFHDITNPYFAELLAAIEDKAAAEGRSLLLGTYGESLERQDRALSTFREYRPDGIIVCPAGGTELEVYKPLIAAGIPIVQVSREIEGSGLDFVGSDDALGTQIAITHLHGLGHRRIALIGGNDRISTGKARRVSYRATMKRLGLAVDERLLVEGFGTRDTGFQGIHALLDLPDPPTAAACFNDLVAFGAMLGLRHRNREAGRDFSLVGCDDVREAAQWYPGLTTIQNHQGEMGAKAAELLLERITHPGRQTVRIVIPPTLVVRGSTVAA